jgi:predicted metal-binding membrane protein
VTRIEHAITVAALLGITALAWAYLYVAGMGPADSMPGMAGMPMPGMDMPAPSPVVTIATAFLMWSAMMTGMMLPSALPMILVFAAIGARRRERGDSYVPTAVFSAGYLLVWVGFSLLAAFAQFPLGMAARVGPLFGAFIVLAAGLYQLTPLKTACLTHCRSPLQFLMTHWREGRAGALRMGIEHGVYCLGCCWLLMGLLFVGGAMNLLWAAALAALVFVEKLLPAGRWIARGSGVALIGYGAYLLAAP